MFTTLKMITAKKLIFCILLNTIIAPPPWVMWTNLLLSLILLSVYYMSGATLGAKAISFTKTYKNFYLGMTYVIPLYQERKNK